MSAFTQINLDVWEARKSGELSNAEFELALYVAFETDFRTGRLTKTVAAVQADLEWENVTPRTVRRRLERVRETGFIAYEVTPRQRQAYVIQPTTRLLKAGRLAREWNERSARACPSGVLDASSDVLVDVQVEAGIEASDQASLPVAAAVADAPVDVLVPYKRREENPSTGKSEKAFTLSPDLPLRDARASENEHAPSPDNGHSVSAPRVEDAVEDELAYYRRKAGVSS